MTKTIFRLSLLPARQGDCLWLEYGPEEHPWQVLIDGGTAETHGQIAARLNKLPAGRRVFELFIVSHIDSDHIGGALKLLTEENAGATFKDTWFNGWRHLPESKFEEFGPVQGEKLTTRLLEPNTSWNQHKPFEGKAIQTNKSGQLPAVELEGGLKLTLLSPGQEQLFSLRPVWEVECRKAGLKPEEPATSSHPAPPGFEVMGPLNIDLLAQEKFVGDPSQANGSSIAILAEYAEKRLLLAGDAYAEVLETNLQRLAGLGGRVKLDAFKLPHHGSRNNLSQSLLEKIDCPLYLFSSDGTQFKHPSRQAVARVIKYGGVEPILAFNYRTPYTLLYDQPLLISQYGYSLCYPPAGEEGLTLDLL